MQVRSLHVIYSAQCVGCELPFLLSDILKPLWRNVLTHCFSICLCVGGAGPEGLNPEYQSTVSFQGYIQQVTSHQN